MVDDSMVAVPFVQCARLWGLVCSVLSGTKQLAEKAAAAELLLGQWCMYSIVKAVLCCAGTGYLSITKPLYCTPCLWEADLDVAYLSLTLLPSLLCQHAQHRHHPSVFMLQECCLD